VIIAYRVVWNKEVEDYLALLKKNMQDIEFMGVIKLSGNIFVLKGDSDTQRFVVLDMSSMLDILMPRLIKRLSFRIGLKKHGYTDKPQYIKDQRLLSILFRDKTPI